MPLVARLVNDASAKCRARVGSTTRLLLQQAGPQAVDTLAGFCAKWLAGDNTQVGRGALPYGSQVLLVPACCLICA